MDASLQLEILPTFIVYLQNFCISLLKEINLMIFQNPFEMQLQKKKNRGCEISYRNFHLLLHPFRI